MTLRCIGGRYRVPFQMQMTNLKYENQIQLACRCVTPGHAVGHAVFPRVMLCYISNSLGLRF